MQYEEWLEDGKRDVVKNALRSVIANGLKPSQQLYFTFRTQFPGVHLIDKLRVAYPEEMTIVLDDAFWELAVQETHFSVDLIFEDKRHHLCVPFKALVNFIDPSTEFALQFKWELCAPSPSFENVIFISNFRRS